LSVSELYLLELKRFHFNGLYLFLLALNCTYWN